MEHMREVMDGQFTKGGKTVAKPTAQHQASMKRDELLKALNKSEQKPKSAPVN